MPKLHRVIDDLTPEELEKVRAVKAASSHGPEADNYLPSERLLAELGSYYGWQAVVDAANGRIAFQSMPGLISGARSLRLQERIENLEDIRVAVAAGIGGKGTDKLFKNYVDKLKRQL